MLETFHWFQGRDPALRFWERTSGPDLALENLLERDRLLTDRLRDEAGTS